MVRVLRLHGECLQVCYAGSSLQPVFGLWALANVGWFRQAPGHEDGRTIPLATLTKPSFPFNDQFQAFFVIVFVSFLPTLLTSRTHAYHACFIGPFSSVSSPLIRSIDVATSGR